MSAPKPEPAPSGDAEFQQILGKQLEQASEDDEAFEGYYTTMRE